MPITPDLSKKLLELKEESGLSYEQIGAEVGTSDANARRYMKGETKVPDRQLLYAIIRCVGGDPDEMLGKKPPAAPAAPFDEWIHRLKDELEKARETAISHQRTHRRMMHVLIALSVALIVLVVIYLVPDLLNGDWGHINY